MKNYQLPKSEIQQALRKIQWKMDDESESFLFKFVSITLILLVLLGILLNDPILGMIGIIILPIGLIWNSWLRSYMYKRLTLIGVAIESLEFRSEKLLTLDSILEKTGITYNAITDIQSRRKFTKLFYSKKIGELYEQFYILIGIFIVNLLTNLRSDLKIRLDEEEKILESAKSEVEKNIQGTTELDDVSKMQKTRLDRQIEQFEELQRVLVKV